MLEQFYKNGYLEKDFSHEDGVPEVNRHKYVKQISSIISIDDPEIILEGFKYANQELLYLWRKKDILLRNLTL